MVDAEHFIFCSLIQENQQGINLLGIFDLIVATRFPAQHQPFMSQIWLRAKKPLYNQDIRLRITIEFEGEQLSEHEVTLEKANALKDDSLRINVDFSGVVFEKPGRYYFKLYVENKQLITRVLRVRASEELVEQ